MALKDGCQAYWKLDESSGNATDSSPNGNTLANVNSMTYGAGKINNGALPSRTGSKCLSITDAAQIGLGFTGDCSFSFWINPDSVSDSYSMLIDKCANGFGTPYSVRKLDSDILFSQGGGNSGSGLFGMSAGTWYHIVVTFKASTHTATFYKNGSSVGSSSTGYTTSITPTSDALYIGSGQANNLPLNGKMDEVGMWNRELTSAEVTELYNGGAGMQVSFSTTTNQTLAAVGAGVSAMLRETSKTLTAVGAGVSTMIRSVSKTLTATGAGIATLLKGMAVTLASTGIGVAVMTVSRAYLVTLAAIGNGIATLSTQNIWGKTLAAVGNGIAVISRVLSLNRTLDAIGVGVSTIAATRGIILTAVGNGVAVMTKTAGKLLAVTAQAVGRIRWDFWRTKYTPQDDAYGIKYPHGD